MGSGEGRITAGPRPAATGFQLSGRLPHSGAFCLSAEVTSLRASAVMLSCAANTSEIQPSYVWRAHAREHARRRAQYGCDLALGTRSFARFHASAARHTVGLRVSSVPAARPRAGTVCCARRAAPPTRNSMPGPPSEAPLQIGRSQEPGTARGPAARPATWRPRDYGKRHRQRPGCNAQVPDGVQQLRERRARHWAEGRGEEPMGSRTARELRDTPSTRGGCLGG